MCLVGSRAVGEDKLNTKRKELSIKYKVLTAEEKQLIEKALPEAEKAVASFTAWQN